MQVSKTDLIHHKIQAALRENLFMDDDLKYLGFNEEKGEHEYQINGQYIVVTSQIQEFDQVEEDDS